MHPPMRILIVAVVAALVVLAAYIVYASGAGPGPVTTRVPSSFSVNGRIYIFTYVATTEPERMAGLMNRTITNQTTMLFAFPSSGQWSFWMYDTNTSLDMIWVSANGSSGSVVYLVKGAQPCYNSQGLGCATYTPTSSADYVIEAKSGFADANGINVGTIVSFT